MTSSQNIIITTGGTGGHIIPAQVLAATLKQNDYNPLILVDANYSKYTSVAKDIKHHIIYSGKFSKNPLVLLKNSLKISLGFVQSLIIIHKNRPQFIVGFGSYASFPVLVAAVLCRQTIILYEQNSVIGTTNKIILPFAKTIVTTFGDTEGIKSKYSFKIRHLGNPVRDSIKKLHNLNYSPPGKNETANILIIGGSGGAKFFSTHLAPAFTKLSNQTKDRIRITQQCRPEDMGNVQKLYQEHEIQTELRNFFSNIEDYIHEAHLIIARAGATSIAELTTAGKPLILVPFPYATNNHQLKNAREVEQAGAAIVITQNDFNEELFVKMIEELIANKEGKLEQIAAAAQMYSKPNADVQFLELLKTTT